MAQKSNEMVIIFGSGTASLLQAFYVMLSGRIPYVISKDPDPANKTLDAEGSTYSGPGQRFITMFEGHPYLEYLDYVSTIYPDIGKDFMKSVLKGGWLAVEPEQFLAETQSWLEERQQINLALISNNPECDQIKKQVRNSFDSYTRENRDAMVSWFKLIAFILEQRPETVEEMSLQTFILRIYDTVLARKTAALGHVSQNILLGELTQDELTEEFSGIKKSILTAGGGLKKYGLGLGIHTVLGAMIDIIKKQGGIFEFNREAKEILIDDKGQVCGVKMTDGKIISGKNFSFNTGSVDAQNIYRNIPGIREKIVAMEGYWVYIKPEVAEKIDQKTREVAVKIHGKQSVWNLLQAMPEERREYYLKRFGTIKGFEVSEKALQESCPVIDFNNRPVNDAKGKPMILMGSGYVMRGHPQKGEDGKVEFVDNKAPKAATELLMRLWAETLYGVILDDKDIKLGKACPRSWSVDDKELFVHLQTSQGGVCSIGGGGNTGSSTKAPFFAKVLVWVIDIFEKTPVQNKTLESLTSMAERVRQRFQKEPGDVTPKKWQWLTDKVEEQKKIAQFKKPCWKLLQAARNSDETWANSEKPRVDWLSRELDARDKDHYQKNDQALVYL